jgi:copper(I)-binding protein
MHRSLLSLIGLLAVMATSCGDGGSGTLEIVDSWAPPTPPNAPAAVIYLTIDNDSNTADQLVAVSSDRCGTIELHATQFDEDRVMRMRLAAPEALRIASGERLEMEPGGLHVMCIDLPSPFVAGEQLELVATLDQAGDIPLSVPVEHR